MKFYNNLHISTEYESLSWIFLSIYTCNHAPLFISNFSENLAEFPL